jgi:peptidylprolyl isomerase
MDNTKFSTTSARVLALMAAAGFALVAGCGNSNQQDGSGEPPSSAEPQQPETQQPGASQTPDTQAPAGATGEQPAAQTPGQTPAQTPDVAAERPASFDQPFTELGITEIKEGDGEVVEPRATVTVHYRGTFRETGEPFDSSYDRGEPAVFPLDGVIAGFSQGLVGMKVGGKRRVDIPWSMAYGERGRPPAIPPKSDLVFELELLGVENPQPREKPELSSEFAGEPVELGDGLVVRDIAVGEGQGEVRPGATVIIHYRGVLAESGEQFDTSFDRGQPAQFKTTEVIDGFGQGLIGMKAGGKRRIEIPAALGYGERGAPPAIPGNADLVFEVELLSFKNQRELSTEWVSERTLDNGLIIRTIREGDAEAQPLPEEAVVTLHTLGVLEDGTRFDSSFEQGEPVRLPLDLTIEGWRQGMVGMLPGEVRQLVVPPALAFGEEGQPPVVPPNATLTFEIELISWEEPRVFSTEFAGEATEVEEGIAIREVKVGEGPEATEGKTAVIHYLAELPDGTVVANTFSTGDMQVVPLNGQPPLPGLRKAIVGMKVGGVRRIELQPQHAFGEEGNPPVIGPDTPMTFEVELMGVQ